MHIVRRLRNHPAARVLLELRTMCMMIALAAFATEAAYGQQYNHPSPFGAYSDEDAPDQILLVWTLPSGSNNAGFAIYRKQTVGDWTQQAIDQAHKIQINHPSQREYEDTGLVPNTYYNYLICATYHVQNSPTLHTQCPLPNAYQNAVTAPDGPRNVVLTAQSHQSVEIRWEHNLTGRIGYVVQRKQGSSWQETANLSANTLVYNDGSLHPNQTYEYRVCARFSNQPNDGNCSVGHQTTTYQQPVAPGNLGVDEGLLSYTGVPNHPDELNRKYGVRLTWGEFPSGNRPDYFLFSASGGPQQVQFTTGSSTNVGSGQQVPQDQVWANYIQAWNLFAGHSYVLTVCAEYMYDNAPSSQLCSSVNYSPPAIYRPAFPEIGLSSVGYYKVDLQWNHNDEGSPAQIEKIELYVYNKPGAPSSSAGALNFGTYYSVRHGLEPMGPAWELLEVYGGGTTSGSYSHDWRSDAMIASQESAFPMIDLIWGPKQYTACATNAVGTSCAYDYAEGKADGWTLDDLRIDEESQLELESRAGIVKIYLSRMNRSSEDARNQISIERNAGRGWQEVGMLDLSTGLLEDTNVREITKVSYRACTEIAGRKECTGEREIHVEPEEAVPSSFEVRPALGDSAFEVVWAIPLRSNAVIVQRSTDGRSFTTLEMVQPGQSRFVDRSVREGQRYFYRLCMDHAGRVDCSSVRAGEPEGDD